MKFFYIIKTKIKFGYHFIITTILYRPFLKKAYGNFIFIHPMQITPQYLTIGKNVIIRHNARIEGVNEYEGIKYMPEIILGDDIRIQQNLHLTCAIKITIGKSTAIAANVTITDINHGYTDIYTPPEKQKLEVKEVIIGINCKIYNNVVILPGTILGKHCIVGANSVVSGEYPDYCVLAGNPARIISKYDRETATWH